MPATVFTLPSLPSHCPADANYLPHLYGTLISFYSMRDCSEGANVYISASEIHHGTRHWLEDEEAYDYHSYK